MKKIYFLHIPKCGGTYIKKHLEKIKNIEFKEISRSPKKAIKEIGEPDSISLTVIRNPFDLLLSWWFSKHQQNPSRGVLPILHEHHANKHINLNYNKNFKHFVMKFIEGSGIPKKSYQYEQNKFLYFQILNSNGGCDLTHIFKTKYLTKSLQSLLNNLNLKKSHIKDIKTRDKKRILSKDDNRINVSRIGKEIDYTQYYDNEMIEAMKEKFKIELSVFDYDFDYNGKEIIEPKDIKITI